MIFLRGLRSALRSLARVQDIAVSVVLTLAPGIGADTAIFSVAVVFFEKDGEPATTNMALYSSKEARGAAFRTGMKEAVSMSFDRLENYLSSPLALGNS